MKKKIIISICSRSFNKGLLNLLNSISYNVTLNKFRTIVLIVINSENKITNLQKKKIKKSLRHFNFNVIYEPRKGVAFARNKSINFLKKTKFHYGCFLDDDCFIKNNYFQNNIDFISKNKCEIVTGPQVSISKKIHHKTFERKFRHKKKINWASTNNVFFKKKIIMNDLNFSNKVTKFGFGEDQLYFSRISRIGYRIMWNKYTKVYESKKNQKEKFGWFVYRNFKYGLTGQLIDLELYGKPLGFFTNLFKVFINLMLSLISLIKIFNPPIQNIYFFLAHILRSLGRLLGIFLKN